MRAEQVVIQHDAIWTSDQFAEMIGNIVADEIRQRPSASRTDIAQLRRLVVTSILMQVPPAGSA